jgi:hypothetical protein
LCINDVLKIFPTTLCVALQIDYIANQQTADNKNVVVQYVPKECSGDIRCSFIGLVGPVKPGTHPLGSCNINLKVCWDYKRQEAARTVPTREFWEPLEENVGYGSIKDSLIWQLNQQIM